MSQPNPEVPPRGKQIDQTRRLLVTAGPIAVAGLAAFGPDILMGGPTPPPAPEQQPQDSDAQPMAQEAPAETEERHGISPLDFGTATAVVGTFGTVVGLSATGRMPFGATSIAAVNGAAAARNVALRTFGGEKEKEIANHELHGLVESLITASALVTFAEVTSHAEMDENALFERITSIGAGLDAEAAKVQMPEVTASAEAWGEYAAHLKNQTVDIATQNFALSGVLAPWATIFTASTFANVMNKRLAGIMADLRYAEVVADAKTVDPSVAINVAEMRQVANEHAEHDMNGADGMVMLSMLNASNIQGIGLWGGAPNLFYLKNNGVQEWLDISGKATVLMNTVGLANLQVWLGKHLGFTDGSVYARSMKTLMQSMPKIVAGIGRSTFSEPDAAYRDNRNWAEELDGMLHRLVKHPGNSTNHKLVEELREKLLSLPRVPFEYDKDGLVRALGEVIGDAKARFQIGRSGLRNIVSGMARMLSGDIYNRVNRAADRLLGEVAVDTEDHAASLPHGLHEHQIDELLELTRGIENLGDLPRVIINRYAQGKHNTLVNHMLEIFDSVLSGKPLDERQKGMLGSIYSQSESQINEAKGAAERALISDDGDALDIALRQLDAAIRFAPADTREAVERWEVTKTGALASDPHAGESRGLDHATKDAIYALMTQLGASSSAAVFVSKLVELTGENMPTWAQNTLVLSLFGGLSTVADNIVAYMAGSQTLKNTHEQRLGAEEFAANTELQKRLERAIYIVATAFGANSNIGSMAALKLEAMTFEYDQATGTNKIGTRKLGLGESMFRPHNIVTSILLLVACVAYVQGAEPEEAAKQQQHAFAQPSR